MRRVIAFSLLFLSVLVVYGAAQCDSIKVHFALNKASLDYALDNNAASMKKFIDALVVSAKSGEIDHITVSGYASPEGPLLNNYKLSIERCNVIADYISQSAGIPRNEIRTNPCGVAWEGLQALVDATPETPYRDEVLAILNEYKDRARSDDAQYDKCLKRLMEIDNGRAYNWILNNLFPKLRYALAICSYQIIDNDASIAESDTTAAADDRNYAQYRPDEGVNYELSPIENFQKPDESLPPLHRLAIKTNLLYDCALLPNLEIEWRVNNNWSVALEGGVAWWGKYSDNKSYRLAMVSPEVKRWFRIREPWHGWYAGVFAGAGLYDFQNGSPGYRGEGVMGGVSAGYMWPIGRNLSLEAAIGTGYLYTRYKEYKPISGHHVYQRTKDIHYFGPLKLKFSLVWRLWNVNKPKRVNDELQNGIAK